MGHSLVSCTNQEFKCDVPLAPMGEKLTAKVKPVLERNEIYYELHDSGEICVSIAQYETLKTVMIEFLDTNIPNDRSISAGPELMKRYKSRFIEDQIPFEVYEMQGEKFYVWQENASESVNSIIDEELDKYKTELEKEFRK